MEEEIDLESAILELQKPCDLGLDIGLSHTAYRHASAIDLYLRTKFH